MSNVEKLPEGQLHTLSTSGVHLRDCPWISSYDASDLYRLARVGWRFEIDSQKPGGGRLEAWEEGEGEPIYLGWDSGDGVWRQLLDLVLPKVTTLQMGRECRLYVKPPRKGFLGRLKGSHGFSVPNAGWGMFAEFVGDIKNDLAHEYPRADYLNSRYRNVLTEFLPFELAELLEACHKLADARGGARRANLSDAEKALVGKAQRSMGAVTISALKGRWRLDSFQL